ncbi:MAG: HlyC/CorC family transporter, partial [Chlamydiia bacterium]|nr:HlyC/CorC family transporter [Chlamydiia bacterium]
MSYLLIALLVILIFGSGFLSASETSLFSLSAMRVKGFKTGKDPRGRQIARLLAKPRKLLVSILMLNVLMNILVQNVVATIFGSSSNWVLNVGVPLVLTLVFGELIPKALAFAHNQWIAYRVVPFYVMIEKFLGPVRNVITRITGWVSRLMFFFLKTEKAVSVEELKMALSTSKKQEILGAEEAKLVRGFLNLEEDLVKEIMRPRAEMIVYDISEPLEVLIGYFVDDEVTRVPVFEGSSEDVIGVLNAGEYFLHREEIKQPHDVKRFLSKPFFVPETMSGKLLLRQMYERKDPMALVVDEYGALAGLITSEDLVELVLGQITDRRDPGSHFTRANDGMIIASGKLELLEFEEIFDVHLDSHNNMATIGGYLTERIGDIPKTGDKITLEGFLFHILSA